MERYQAWIGAWLLAVGLAVGMLASAAVASAAPDAESNAGETTDAGQTPASGAVDSSDAVTEPQRPTNPGDLIRSFLRRPFAGVRPFHLFDRAESEPAEEETAEDTAVSDNTEVVDSDGRTTADDAPEHPLTPVDVQAVETHDAPVVETVDVPAVAITPELDRVEDESLTLVVPAAVSNDRASLVTVRHEPVLADVVSFVNAVAPALDATPAASLAAAPTFSLPQPQDIPVVNVIGSFVFNAIAFVIHLVEGPPVLPAGSTVTVRRSTLEIDGADGPVVPADWYFPDGEKGEPEGIIYLQHGFLASGPMYSYTAATLAQETNSIVVVPSLSSNVFAADQYWLGGEPMMKAVANLFDGDRTALLASARAAGYTDDELPQTVVLVGHSLGGGLVTAAAGYMADDDSIKDLAGVITLDGVSFSVDAVPRALTNLDRKGYGDLPIYQIASPPYLWNLDGQLGNLLNEYRPDQFNGVTLEGGAHIDSMQGGNPLLQIGAYVLAGFSQPRNIEAVPILAVGWINDWYANTDKGVYPAPGSATIIPTEASPGYAVAVAVRKVETAGVSALQLAS